MFICHLAFSLFIIQCNGLKFPLANVSNSKLKIKIVDDWKLPLFATEKLTAALFRFHRIDIFILILCRLDQK